MADKKPEKNKKKDSDEWLIWAAAGVGLVLLLFLVKGGSAGGSSSAGSGRGSAALDALATENANTYNTVGSDQAEILSSEQSLAAEQKSLKNALTANRKRTSSTLSSLQSTIQSQSAQIKELQTSIAESGQSEMAYFQKSQAATTAAIGELGSRISQLSGYETQPTGVPTGGEIPNAGIGLTTGRTQRRRPITANGGAGVLQQIADPKHLTSAQQAGIETQVAHASMAYLKKYFGGSRQNYKDFLLFNEES